MASPCLCKPPMASEPTSHAKPVTKQMFGKASPEAAREAAPEDLPNGALIMDQLIFSYRRCAVHNIESTVFGTLNANVSNTCR